MDELNKNTKCSSVRIPKLELYFMFPIIPVFFPTYFLWMFDESYYGYLNDNYP